MCFELTAAALRLPATVRGVARNVLIALAHRADRERHSCWPTVETLCADVGWSRRAVLQALADLERAGLISRTPGGPGRATTYVVHLGAAEKVKNPASRAPEKVKNPVEKVKNPTVGGAGGAPIGCTTRTLRVQEPHPEGAPRAHQLSTNYQGTGKERSSPQTPKGGWADAGGFAAFWSIYPHNPTRRTNEATARRLYAAAIAQGVAPELILAGAQAAHFDVDVQRDRQRSAAAWLRQAGWEDEWDDGPTTAAELHLAELRAMELDGLVPGGER